MTEHGIDETAVSGESEARTNPDAGSGAGAGATTGTGAGTDFGLLPTAIAAITVLVIGLSLGTPVSTAGALLAAGGLVAGLSLLSSRSLVPMAAGSCAFVSGFALAGGVVVAGYPVAGLGTFAIVVTAATALLRMERYTVVSRTFRDSAVLSVVVGTTLLAILGGVVGTTATAARLLLETLTLTASTAVASLVFLVVVTLVLLDLANPVLEPRLPDDVPLPSMVSVVNWAIDLPKGIGYVVGAIAFLAFSVDVSSAFESALAALGPVGAAIELLFGSGLVHAPIALIALLVTVVLLGHAVSPLVRIWLGSYPLRTLALASGGGVVTVVMAAATIVAPDLVLPRHSVAVFGALVLAAVLATVIGAVSWMVDTARNKRYGLALGSIALFAAVTIGALAELEPLAVFGGVAASILVWDLGENTLALRTQLGGGVDTREPELVHAAGSLAVGVLGVTIAAVAMYVLGNVSPPAERWQALVPFVLALVAVFVLGLAVHRPFGTRVEATLDWARRVDTSRLPSRYPFVVRIATALLVCLVLIAAGYELLVFFLVLFGIPFGLLVFLNSASDNPHNHRL